MISSAISSALYSLLHHQARMRVMEPETYTGETTLVILLFGLGFAAVTAAGVGVWWIIVTHRICGPLFVLSRYFEELATGRVPRPRPLRQKDEFKEVYAGFKKATDSLRAQRQSELAVLTEMEAEAESAMGGNAEACKNALESVAMQLGDLRKVAAESLGESADDGPCTAATGIAAAQTPVAVG